MNGTKNSLPETLSALLGALWNFQPQPSDRIGTTITSGQQTIAGQEECGVIIETVPELLDFLKSSRNPKALRDVVARFLCNPLLSESDRELIRKKVREKIDEEKRKKRDSKLFLTSTNNCAPSVRSSQHIVDKSPNFTRKLPSQSASIGNLLSRHGYAGFQEGTTPMCLNGTVSSTGLQRDMIPRTPTPPRSHIQDFDSCIRPCAIVAVISGTGRLIMPGAPVMSRSFKGNCADSDVMEDSTVIRQEYNAKSLENSEEISRREDRNEEPLTSRLFGSPKKIDSLFDSSVKISSLFDSLEHEPLGEACYIQQYALRHNLSLEEAGRKVEENGMIGKRVTKRCPRKKAISSPYTKGFQPLPDRKFAKNYEGTEENIGQLDCDGSNKRSKSIPQYRKEGEMVEVHEAGFDGSTHSSSNYVTDSVYSEPADFREYWPPVYPSQCIVTEGAKRKRKLFEM